jgi:hypothetical protein
MRAGVRPRQRASVFLHSAEASCYGYSGVGDTLTRITGPIYRQGTLNTVFATAKTSTGIELRSIGNKC